ncbi:MAG: MCP four helix bundle domain-containing protein [Candidatus Omnitrophota bacterium]
MNRFSNMKFSTKIIVSYMLLFFIIVALGAFSITQLNNVNYIATEIEKIWLPATRTLGDINKCISELRIIELQHISSSSKDDMDRFENQAKEIIGGIASEQSIYEPLIVLNEEKILYASFRENWARYIKETERIFALSRENKKSEALSMLRDESQLLYNNSSDSIIGLINLNEHGGIDLSQRADFISSLSSLQIVILIVAGLFVGISASTYITYSLLVYVRISKKYQFLPAKH